MSLIKFCLGGLVVLGVIGLLAFVADIPNHNARDKINQICHNHVAAVWDSAEPNALIYKCVDGEIRTLKY